MVKGRRAADELFLEWGDVDRVDATESTSAGQVRQRPHVSPGGDACDKTKFGARYAPGGRAKSGDGLREEKDEIRRYAPSQATGSEKKTKFGGTRQVRRR